MAVAHYRLVEGFTVGSSAAFAPETLNTLVDARLKVMKTRGRFPAAPQCGGAFVFENVISRADDSSMSRILQLLSVIAVLSTVACNAPYDEVAVGSAEAVSGTPQTVSVPLSWQLNGNTVDVWVGAYTGLQKQIAIYRNKQTGACFQTIVSDFMDNWDHDVTFNLSGGDDSFTAVGPEGAYVNCPAGGTPIGSIMNTRQGIFVYGGYGADRITMNVPGGFAHGGPGSDVLIANASAGLYGEDDNDTLYANVGQGVSLFGGNGDDCLSVPASSTDYLDCGAGSDRYAGTSGSVTGCESVTFSCTRLP